MKWIQNGDPIEPTPRAIIETQCYHCGQVTRHLANRVADAEAQHWREKYSRLIGSLNDALEACTKEHGDNPIARESRFLLERLKEIRQALAPHASVSDKKQDGGG